ncbi:hypothetical protein [Bdellovibrio sp. HCB209]|uniref:hypothetical protein n=1 Tax=Bdellovibrio sp. HCB209 TaxID=3394354 RepID=UPI0039B3E388
MKNLLIVLPLFFATSAMAENIVCKQVDAQIVAQIDSIKALPGTGLCTAQLNFDGYEALYAANSACPLSFDEVMAKGIVVRCDRQAGDKLAGLLHRSVHDTTIYFYTPESF